MKVRELIEKLKLLPLESNVWYIWDGEPRTEADVAYLAKSGDVMIAGYGDIVYSDESRPINAPTEDKHWHIEDGPERDG